MPIWWLRADTVPVVHPLKTREGIDFYGNVTANFRSLSLSLSFRCLRLICSTSIDAVQAHWSLSFVVRDCIWSWSNERKFGFECEKKNGQIQYPFFSSFVRSLSFARSFRIICFYFITRSHVTPKLFCQRFLIRQSLSSMTHRSFTHSLDRCVTFDDDDERVRKNYTIASTSVNSFL